MNSRSQLIKTLFTRWGIRIVILTGIAVSVVGFFPTTFEIMDCQRSHKTFTVDGQVVVRYGLSRIRSEGAQDGSKDGLDFGGNLSNGRCFVDYYALGVIKRRYGWTLSVRSFYSGSPIRVKKVIVECL